VSETASNDALTAAPTDNSLSALRHGSSDVTDDVINQQQVPLATKRHGYHQQIAGGYDAQRFTASNRPAATAAAASMHAAVGYLPGVAPLSCLAATPYFTLTRPDDDGFHSLDTNTTQALQLYSMPRA